MPLLLKPWLVFAASENYSGLMFHYKDANSIFSSTLSLKKRSSAPSRIAELPKAVHVHTYGDDEVSIEATYGEEDGEEEKEAPPQPSDGDRDENYDTDTDEAEAQSPPPKQIDAAPIIKRVETAINEARETMVKSELLDAEQSYDLEGEDDDDDEDDDNDDDDDDDDDIGES